MPKSLQNAQESVCKRFSEGLRFMAWITMMNGHGAIIAVGQLLA
jgi:hypothetical protein